MQAIVTKFLGQTETLPHRIVATAGAGRVVLSLDAAQDAPRDPGVTDDAAPHIAAARALCERFGWDGTWHGGGLPMPGYGYVFVCEGGPVPVSFTVAEGEG